jgi:predicted RNA-binding Zn ribbon-like protein
MSKQQRAPGDLEHVRAFVNTIDVEQDHDELASPAGLAAWLQSSGLMPPAAAATSADLAHAVALREALRAILLAHSVDSPVPREAAQTLDSAAARARVRLHFDERGAAVLEPEAGGVDGGLGRLLSIVHQAIAQETWTRLKACRDHTCEWAFYDHTKNRSGAWCNMAVCGNRAKARAYRERRAAPGSRTRLGQACEDEG